ncbi:MAG: cytochrome P450 [Bermanella sp.]
MSTPLTADFIVDPYSVPLDSIDVSDSRMFLHHTAWKAYFERLRNEDPIHFQKESDFGPFWSITRFEDIQFVDKHHELFSSEPAVVIGDMTEELPLEMFIAMDNPRHDEQRVAAQPVVAPKNLAEMESLIKERVDIILDSLPIGETFDWVDKVSIELTGQMLATLFDFPQEDRRKLTYWSDLALDLPEVTGGDGTHEVRNAGLQECFQRFNELWEERTKLSDAERADKFDLISLLQNSEKTKDMVDRPMEFLGNIMLLIVGGNDTTRNSLTGGILAINKYPDEFEKIKKNPGLIPNMVPEIIRWQTPLSHMRRIATQDVELGGKTIKKGDKVVMWYASGNRDERVIDNPDAFIVDRPKARHHLSFGFGIHRCMGNRLAEMQIRITWEEILKRFEKIEVMKEPSYVKSNFVKGYTELLVKLTAK